VNKATASMVRNIGSAVVLFAVSTLRRMGKRNNHNSCWIAGAARVSLEAYAPNIIRVTLSLQKDPALAPPGFGFVATPSASRLEQPGERQK
jgi:hypothetical protein